MSPKSNLRKRDQLDRGSPGRGSPLPAFRSPPLLANSVKKEERRRAMQGPVLPPHLFKISLKVNRQLLKCQLSAKST